MHFSEQNIDLIVENLFFIYVINDKLQYHGGTNFGRSAGGPFITTSYDYDAPIDEYGEIFILESSLKI